MLTPNVCRRHSRPVRRHRDDSSVRGAALAENQPSSKAGAGRPAAGAAQWVRRATVLHGLPPGLRGSGWGRTSYSSRGDHRRRRLERRGSAPRRRRGRAGAVRAGGAAGAGTGQQAGRHPVGGRELVQQPRPAETAHQDPAWENRSVFVPPLQRSCWSTVPVPALRAGSMVVDVVGLRGRKAARCRKKEATMSRGCQDRRGKIWRIAAVFAASGALALSGCTSSTETGRTDQYRKRRTDHPNDGRDRREG